MEKKYTHIGKLEKAENGSLVITSDNGAKYTVDQGVASIWNMFDGKTVEEVAHVIAGESSPEDAKKAVQQVADRLFEIGILKPVE